MGGASTVGAGDLRCSYGFNRDCGWAWQRLRFLSGLNSPHDFFKVVSVVDCGGV